ASRDTDKETGGNACRDAYRCAGSSRCRGNGSGRANGAVYGHRADPRTDCRDRSAHGNPAVRLAYVPPTHTAADAHLDDPARFYITAYITAHTATGATAHTTANMVSDAAADATSNCNVTAACCAADRDSRAAEHDPRAACYAVCHQPTCVDDAHAAAHSHSHRHPHRHRPRS